MTREQKSQLEILEKKLQSLQEEQAKVEKEMKELKAKIRKSEGIIIW